MDKDKQRLIDAGKKIQEIEDMNLLGALIARLGGEVHLLPSELIPEGYVERSEDPKTGGLILKSYQD